MPTFASSADLNNVFGGFIESISKDEVKGFSGIGMVLAYTVSEPAGRFVLDTRQPAKPGFGFRFFANDVNAPEASVDILVTGDVLDKMFGGELNVMGALATGQIKTKGDQISAVRLLPVMFRLVPLYKAFREQYFAVHGGSAQA